MGFTSSWDYKQYKDYTSQKIVNLSITSKIHLKCDVIYGNVVNGLKQSILYSFLLDKPVGYKVLSQTETVHLKKIKAFWLL